MVAFEHLSARVAIGPMHACEIIERTRAHPWFETLEFCEQECDIGVHGESLAVTPPYFVAGFETHQLQLGKMSRSQRFLQHVGHHDERRTEIEAILAAAPRLRPPAGTIGRLHHTHRDTGAREMERGTQPRKTRADDQGGLHAERSEARAMPILESLHVAAGVLWLGNFVVTGIWATRAFRSGDERLRRFAVREILFTDIIFTLIFGSAVITSGLALAARLGIDPWQTLWTRDALAIAIASGVLWLAVLVPIEIHMERRARAGESAALTRPFLAWSIVGWTVTLALFSIIYFMLAKPV